MRELFLILDAYGDRSQLIAYLLEPLTASIGRPDTVRAHYRRDIDVALIGLAYSDAPHDLARLRLLAERSGIKIIDPAELDDAGRRSFYDNQLSAYPVVVEQRELKDTLAELSRRIARGTERPETVPLRPPGRSPGEYRLKPLTGGARGTRDHIPTPTERPSPIARGTRSELVREVDTRPPVFADPAVRPRVGRRHVKHISVHVSRGDEWVAGRLRFLSARRVAVAATAMPKVGDSLELAIAYAGIALTLPAVVDSVDRAVDLETPISTGFSATLEGLTPQLSAKLVELLQQASADGVRLSPPPLRPARFAVSWPLIVAPVGGEPARVTALDLSLDGMFIRQCGLASQLEFALPLDERNTPAIRGRLEVVREMSADEANERGFTPGAGVAIRELAPGDRTRYDALVRRVRARNGHRLLVGAGSDQLAALVTGLRAVGYAVSSCSDPSEVVESISGKLRPDIAVIDSSLTRLEGEEDLLLSLLREHSIFTVAVSGERAERTRRSIDDVLGIDRD